MLHRPPAWCKSFGSPFLCTRLTGIPRVLWLDASPQVLPSCRNPTMVNTHLSHDLPLHLGHRLLRLLGRGNFGEVWEAESPQGDRVALKFLPFSSDQAAVHELRAAAGRSLQPSSPDPGGQGLVRPGLSGPFDGVGRWQPGRPAGRLPDRAKNRSTPEDLCPLLTQAAAARTSSTPGGPKREDTWQGSSTVMSNRATCCCSARRSS